MPVVEDIVRIIQDEKTLNHSSSQEGERCETSLPS
jgi:hypothetical protein